MLDKAVERVTNLLTAVTIYTESPKYVDVMANALSKEPISRTLYDALRTVEAGLSSGDIKVGPYGSETKYQAIVVIKEEGEGTSEKPVYGSLPSEDDLKVFLDEVEKDIYVARRAAVLAMGKVAKILSASGEGGGAK
ncbi:type I-A CRISPR-associated protein Csa5 [Acidilobus sp.]|uniref:type I-A CRISPR-associated protein Csa5 n=1 Tax=Acidilobus sp. TaxID=1872109 RepID=UPI003D03ACA8